MIANTNSATALVFRSAALFAILYQLRFVADDLADTAVFLVTLCAAFASAVFLVIGRFCGARTMNPLAAIISIGLVPWAVRFFIALPRLFIPGGNFALAVTLDSLLLNFDRNNFVSLLPFYWAAVSTWFAIRSRLFLRAAVIVDAVIMTAIFSFTPIFDFAPYRWPIVLIVTLAAVVFMQALGLLFSLPPEIRLRKKEKTFAIAALLLLAFIGGLLFLKPSQERAVQRGGGLLKPQLLSFDFSQVLKLDTEISMGDDLILIVKKDPRDNHILLRRSVLSGYSKKQGFYRMETLDEKSHPQRLPSRTTALSPVEFKLAQRVKQEYFVMNFDSAAFIGMKEPAEIIPYENWDSSSFKSAYAVESLVSNFDLEKMGRDISPELSLQDFGLSEKEFAVYTNYDGDERIKALAEEITQGIDSYSGKVEAIHDWLKYGGYRYSLKPGIAPDGDQLAWFLFNSKKGYCTYYAFAMSLMLRSLGIPARVTAGFFIDPEDGAFDYYPVRSGMAHAWVEVPFPGYGWIEFDPTTEILAEGEEFHFSSGVDPNLFERLMREILENRSQLREKMGQDDKGAAGGRWPLANLAATLVKKVLPLLLILLLIIVLVIIKFGYLLLSVMGHNSRKKAVNLWKHTRRRLWFAGLGCPAATPEFEWALQCDRKVGGTYAMYLGAAAARFAPDYQNDDFLMLQNIYCIFSESYRTFRQAQRRKLKFPKPPRKSGLILLLLFAALAAGDSRAQDADPAAESNDLYQRGIMAEYSEFWERAIELFKEGGEKYPQDPRFPRALGRLYYSRSLYNLAWDEYRKTELINPYDTYVLYRLANTAGHLNRDKTAVAYLEKLLTIEPDNREAINNLGWMYYKIHRLKDGEQLLVSAIERLGEDADFAMTLATVYSDMYRYDEGKHWYQKAIALAEASSLPELWRGFIAVAHYNLSIVESRFYHFDRALDEANASIFSQNRASGLLARGELSMQRLDLQKALVDFDSAREIDSSPLAKLDLAQIYQISGRLEEARLYALDCLKASDQSWMINFGIDPIRYKRDLHNILYKTYSGLAMAERFNPSAAISDKIRSSLNVISFRFYSSVHRKLYQKYSLVAGDAYDETLSSVSAAHGDSGEPPLDQFLQYYNAFETYPHRALFYLNKAQNFETAIIPESAASYYLEKGILLKDKNLVTQALDTLNPAWEQELISKCYREFARRGPARANSKRQTAAEELFALNRGALLQAGIGLPLEINMYNAGKSENDLRQTLAAAGLSRAKTAARFRLDIVFQRDSASCGLFDTEDAKKPRHITIPLPSLSRTDRCAFARVLSNFVFKVE